MILQRFVRCKIHNIFRESEVSVVFCDSLFGLGGFFVSPVVTPIFVFPFVVSPVFIAPLVFFRICFFHVSIQKIRVVDDDLAFLLVGDGFEERVDRQRLAVFREHTIRPGFHKLFVGVFHGRSFKLRIAERFAVDVKTPLGFRISLTEVLYVFYQLLCDVLTAGVVHILRFRSTVFVFA